jgi:hypothetical protein
MKKLINWLLLVQLVGLLITIVNMIHDVGIPSEPAVILKFLVWPTLIEPAWLGLVASILAVILLCFFAGVSDDRKGEQEPTPPADSSA